MRPADVEMALAPSLLRRVGWADSRKLNNCRIIHVALRKLSLTYNYFLGDVYEFTELAV